MVEPVRRLDDEHELSPFLTQLSQGHSVVWEYNIYQVFSSPLMSMVRSVRQRSCTRRTLLCVA
jgi:hypothetical protein